jgi:hypothetical protein
MTGESGGTRVPMDLDLARDGICPEVVRSVEKCLQPFAEFPPVWGLSYV